MTLAAMAPTARRMMEQVLAVRPGERLVIVNLTRSLADELAPRGSAVNCVAPGRILSDRRRERLAGEARQYGVPAEEGEP